MRQRAPEAVDGPEEVHVEHAAQLVRLVAIGLGVDGDDGVRDVGVDAPEPVDRLLDDLLHLVLDGVVGGNGERLRSGRLDLRDGVLERLGVPRRDHDLCPAHASQARNGAAQPARGSGDDHDLL